MVAPNYAFEKRKKELEKKQKKQLKQQQKQASQNDRGPEETSPPLTSKTPDSNT
jgi:hypothetical protein